MNRIKWYCVFASIAFSLARPAGAQESAIDRVVDPVLAFLASDIYRASFGAGSLKLRNSEGFDVDSGVHEDGLSPDNFLAPGSFSWSVEGERQIGWDGRQKRVWSVYYDSDDYDGLKLQSLMVGGGVALDPSQAFSLGVRVASGLGLGLTRSSTYFDSALHPSIEVWLSGGIQVGRLFLDLSRRERQAMGASLDERRASPRTETTMLSIGWLF